MKILMVNKFLYPKGGAEAYVFKLAEALQERGHEVQYFGMDHPERTAGNNVNAYTANMDFHGGSWLAKMTYPLRIIYSIEARWKIRKVLENFQPDVCHLNNFNYQLTPSIILEIRKWEKKSGCRCKIIYTAHDYQLVCPNHMCMNPNTGKLCERCLWGNYTHCIKGRCIHGSVLRSMLGAMESWLWHTAGVYTQLDAIVCCSHFIKTLLDIDPVLVRKTVALHNFFEEKQQKQKAEKSYILYFGRYSQEKGLKTLLEAARMLPRIPFVFAGSGPMEYLLEEIPNVQNVGFQSGEALDELIRQARFSVIPSEWYENCPFSVLESLSLGTPVLGADIGGIPELVCTGINGELFESGNKNELIQKILDLWEMDEMEKQYPPATMHTFLVSKNEYAVEIEKIYGIEEQKRDKIYCSS